MKRSPENLDPVAIQT